MKFSYENHALNNFYSDNPAQIAALGGRAYRKFSAFKSTSVSDVTRTVQSIFNYGQY